jgi:hypothetical protein
MTKTRLAALAVTLCLGVAPVANAATINFKALADPPTGADERGESAWDPLIITIAPGFTVTITAKDGGSDAYAYLDSNNAGLGVCEQLTNPALANTYRVGLTSNICDPSSNDNVKSGETLHFVFNQNVRIDGIWFNNNHDTDFSLSGDSITIGGSSYGFPAAPFVIGDLKATGPWNVAAGASFDIGWETDQFYMSLMDVTAVPEPASVFGAGLGVLGIGLLRRYFNRPLR